MKTGARVLLLALVLGTAGCMNLSEPFAPMHPRWHDYSSIQSRHFVNFPGRVSESVKETKIVSGQTVSTYLREFQAGDRYYGTAWTLIPGAHSGTRPQVNPLLEVAADEALKSARGAKFIDKRPIAVDGHTGLAYVVDVPQSKTRLRQQIFLVTGVLVEQTYAGPAGTEAERDAGRFFDSLKLLP